MNKKGKRPTVEEELAELDAKCRDPQSPAAQEALREALRRGTFLVAVRAAKIIARSRLDDMQEDLREALERLFREPPKRDPGCRAQSAVVDALDQLECMVPAPFLAAARRVQLEPGYGGPTDAAGGVRSRGIAGLARIGFGDFLLVAGHLAGDPEAGVRQATMDALGHFGERAGAGIALMRMRLGDPEPQVVLASMNALLSLAPDWGVETLRPILFGHDDDARELAALALGQSRHEETLKPLLELYETTALAEERLLVVRALGFSRHPRARALLLDAVATGREAEAEAAVLALGEQRFEPGLKEQVLEAASRNAGVRLDAAVARAFSPSAAPASR